MTKHFTLTELSYSRTAVENGLLNMPDEKAKSRLLLLAENLLEPLREALDAPIVVTSGYRSPEVNRLVGGVGNSQHVTGEAADCYCAAGPDHLLETLLRSGLAFDQAIVYGKKNMIHLSYCAGKNRKMVVNSFKSH